MKELRKRRLQHLLDIRFKGVRADLCAAAEITNGRLSQLLDPDMPFGDTAAARLVSKLRLPDDYFESSSAAGAAGERWPFKHFTLARLDALTPEEREHIDRTIAALLTAYEKPLSGKRRAA